MVVQTVAPVEQQSERRLEVEDHLPLVRFVMKRMKIIITPDMGYEDYYHEGVIGLIQAINRYNPEIGKFSGYAVIRIRGAILDAMRKRMPYTRYQWQKLPEEVLEKMVPIGIENEDGEPTRAHELIEEAPYQLVEDMVLVEALMSSTDMPEREQRLIREYFWWGSTMKKISEGMEISESRVCQLIHRAVRKLNLTFEEGPSAPATGAKGLSQCRWSLSSPRR